ncbi:MAG: RteC domain-containing protein [Draconibacterium sp.]
MEKYTHIITELEVELKRISMNSESMLNTAKSAIKRCRVALVELRWVVVNQGFPDTKSEIRFFKKIKPAAHSRLLFYQAVFEMESFRSNYDPDRIRRYLKVKLDEIQMFTEENAGSVQYHNCGFTHLDSLYFVRKREEIPIELRGEYYLMDEEFNTWQDYNFSVIRANEMLQEYLSQVILKLESPQVSGKLQRFDHLDWTANKIDLVELIYALYFSKAINNGKITIKELGELVGQIFGIDITKDVYRYFIEIQQRKIEQTKFIAFLQSVLQQHIDQNI